MGLSTSINVLIGSSKMPYGKYKNTSMDSVPDDYLKWLWDNDKCSETVKSYIERNLDAINKNLEK